MSPPVRRRNYCFSRLEWLNYKKKTAAECLQQSLDFEKDFGSLKRVLSIESDFGVDFEVLEAIWRSDLRFPKYWILSFGQKRK